MERPIEQAVRDVERLLRFATHDPFFVKRLKAAAGTEDSHTQVNGLKNRLEHCGTRPAEALTLDISESEPKVSIYQSGINRHGQKIGIQLTLTLENRK